MNLSIFNCFGPEKNRWKNNGNYYSSEELKKMDSDTSITLRYPVRTLKVMLSKEDIEFLGEIEKSAIAPYCYMAGDAIIFNDQGICNSFRRTWGKSNVPKEHIKQPWLSKADDELIGWRCTCGAFWKHYQNEYHQ